MSVRSMQDAVRECAVVAWRPMQTAKWSGDRRSPFEAVAKLSRADAETAPNEAPFGIERQMLLEESAIYSNSSPSPASANIPYPATDPRAATAATQRVSESDQGLMRRSETHWDALGRSDQLIFDHHFPIGRGAA